MRARQDASKENPIRTLLESGKAVFGAFSEKTRESAAKLSADNQLDFVFYDMETGPFDIAGMKDFMSVLGSKAVAARASARCRTAGATTGTTFPV